MDKNKINYIALLLNNNSQEVLKDFLNKTAIYYVQNKTNGWKNYRVICHHMTIVFNTDLDNEILEYCNENEGKEFIIKGYELGYSDKAIAIKVKTNCKSKNKIKHITLAVNNDTKGNPVDSNYITNWIKIDEIKLKGNVFFFAKN